MEVEFEATFIDINVNEIRDKLKQLGAELEKPETLMRRMIFSLPGDDNIRGAWLRVRDEGDKITMSLKEVSGDKIEDQKELCLIIDSFDQGKVFLESLGAKAKAYQETKREVWLYDKAELSIDTWPGLDPVVEIEAENEEMVRKVSEALGFDYSKAVFGTIATIYHQVLGITPDDLKNNISEITFENPPVNRN